MTRPYLSERLVQIGSPGGLEALLQAEKRSLEIIRDAREYAGDRMPGQTHVQIVAFGSLGRREYTDASDLDHLVIVRDRARAQDIRKAREVADEICGRVGSKNPGASGMFGVAIGTYDLLGRIGLESDTNHTQTRRLLLLEESVGLQNIVQHEALLSDILERYLVEYHAPKAGIPRLLLNDVVRYWRTLAVDYQAKNWSRLSPEGWGLRYLKLRITRKITFAGMLAAVYMPALEGVGATKEYLFDVLMKPSLVRLLLLHDHLDEERQKDLVDCLRVASRFNQCLADESFRSMASSVKDHTERSRWPAEFLEMQELSEHLQEKLSQVFFRGEGRVSEITYKYCLF